MKKLLWTDFHSNLHHTHIENYLEDWYKQAKEMLDFWAIVYYPFKPYEGSKEDIISTEVIEQDVEKIIWHNSMTYLELIDKLTINEAITIPHHPGYAVGHRGKNRKHMIINILQ